MLRIWDTKKKRSAYFLITLVVISLGSCKDSSHSEGNRELDDFPPFDILNGEHDDDGSSSVRKATVHVKWRPATSGDDDYEYNDGGEEGEEMTREKSCLEGRKPDCSRKSSNSILGFDLKHRKRSGPIKLNVDDKDGLVADGPYKKDKKGKSSKKKNTPKICEDGETKCEKVDSRVRDPDGADPDSDRLLHHPRSRRAAESSSDCGKEVSIEAFGSKYDLCINLKSVSEEPILKRVSGGSVVNVTVFGANNVSRDQALDKLDLKVATGFVKGEDFTSASGFLMDGNFYGTVYMRDAVHYLEPHDRKSKDMHIFGDGLKTLLHKHTIKPSKNPSPSPDKSSKAKDRRLCDITAVADHLFFQEIGESSVEKTVLQMLWHIKEANAIFQSRDFDDDGSSECLGFTVSEITVFQKEESAVNLLTGEYEIPEDFLKRFSRYNFDGFCLGVLFTNRAFNELVLGLSWRGNPKPDGVGGICQGRVRIKSDKNAYSFNALFISLKSSQEERIPLRMGVLNLVHEMMHAFGAKHDPDAKEDPRCTPPDKWMNGRYLMSKYSNDGHKLNHEILSPCTKELVVQNMASETRTSCLKKDSHPSFCGDGIVQDGEECDCGTVFQCIAARSCCVPPEGSNPCTKDTKLQNCA